MSYVEDALRCGIAYLAISFVACGRIGYDLADTPAGVDGPDAATTNDGGAAGSNAETDADVADRTTAVDVSETGVVSEDGIGFSDVEASLADSASPREDVSNLDVGSRPDGAIADASMRPDAPPEGGAGPADAQKTILCPSGQPCNPVCTSDCNILCAQGATCNVTCSGIAQCSIVCSTGATCKLTCAQSGRTCTAGPGGMGALMKADQNTCS